MLRAQIVLMVCLVAFGDGARHDIQAQETTLPPIVLFAQGVAALTEKRFAEARSIFTQVVEMDSRHAEGRYYLGVCEAKLKNYSVALQHLDEAVSCDSSLATRLRSDGLLASEEDDEQFVLGLHAIMGRLDRRDRGDVAGSSFDFELQDSRGETHRLVDFRGAPLVVVFLDESSGNSLDAGLLIDRLRMVEGAEFQAVAIVRVRGKTVENQVNALESYVSTSRLTLPLLLSDGAVERQLRPFRRYPTALFLDAMGKPQRIVEGHSADLEAQYRAARASLSRGAETAPKTPPTSQPSTGRRSR